MGTHPLESTFFNIPHDAHPEVVWQGIVSCALAHNKVGVTLAMSKYQFAKHKHMFATCTPSSDGHIVVCHTGDFHPHILEGYCRVAAPKGNSTFMFVCHCRYGSMKFVVLIDTGASHSVISTRAVETAKLQVHHNGPVPTLQSAGSHT
jgi:hypothetical protein